MKKWINKNIIPVAFISISICLILISISLFIDANRIKELEKRIETMEVRK